MLSAVVLFRLSNKCYSWIGPPMQTNKQTKMPDNREGYERSETTFEKLSARRIDPYRVHLYIVIFWQVNLQKEMNKCPNKNR